MPIKRNTLSLIFVFLILGIVFNVLTARGSQIAVYPLAIAALVLFFLIWNKKLKETLLFLGFFSCLQLITVVSIPAKPKQAQFNVKIIKIGKGHVIAKENDIKYLIYFEEECGIGDIIEIKGRAKEIDANPMPNLFDFKEYLYFQRVYYQIEADSYKLIPKKDFRRAIYKFLFFEMPEQSSSIIRTLLFQENIEEVQLRESLTNLSLVYLISVSGLQINLLINMFYLLLKKIIKPNSAKLISILIIFPYIYLIGFPIAAVRAFMQSIWYFIKKKRNWGTTRLDLLALTGIILIILNPLVIFSSAFIYSFLMTTILIVSSSIYKKRSKLSQICRISIIAYWGLLPLTMLNDFAISPATPMLNILISPFILFLYILAWLALLFAIFRPSLIFSVNLLTNFSQFIERFNPILVTGKPSPMYLIIYYLILSLIIIYYQKKMTKQFYQICTAFLAIVIFQPISPHLNFFDRAYFLDVGQGDATLIVEKLNRSVTLIDTGGWLYSDLAEKRLIPFFKSLGLRQIDHLFITHPDFDHSGASTSLIDNFIVKKITTNNSFEEIIVGNIKFQNLNSNPNYASENDNSQVLYFCLGQRSYLIPGDISAEVELDIITKYPNLKIDILHLAHHGSKTSTSEQFVDAIKPTYAIISAGINNRYGHPSKEVLARLEIRKIMIFRTDYNGLIIFINYGSRLWIYQRF